ncbi:uncharacterized protein EDB93DRAFT_823917 [Suillus bovinus]|uniref:uncharacterized protein n=1 Tax=Suillus bovinus TaxID=48563 RepID=UPI001B863814|nr:uncharacterized protein EDB93DRAFT_823917 [Suillus bovinus]KAG2135754.1 hypothetical protein EDB93DRAFT_823917 [Suillus bovinus]
MANHAPNKTLVIATKQSSILAQSRAHSLYALCVVTLLQSRSKQRQFVQPKLRNPYSQHAASAQHVQASQKCPLPPPEETTGSNKKVCTDRAPLASRPHPCCAVCLGHHSHRIIECVAVRTWDKQHETFSERIRKSLWTKDGKQLCTAWQREEGCTIPRHDARHICLGCGDSSHGAQKCARAQKAEPTNTI